jgi:putative peptide zinc metalloprotease protein
LRPEPDEAPLGGRPPRLAEGIELVGEFQGSGFKEAPYIVRRADGQVVQLPHLLYLVAGSVDGRREYAEIGERVSEQFGRGLDAEGAQILVEKLVPLGVVAPLDGSPEQQLAKNDPLLALKLKTGVVPERVVRTITVIFKPLFYPPVVLAMLAGFFALDVWLFVFHGVAQSLRDVLYDPLFILLLLAMVVVSAAFHECGHATACAYGGATPGEMGVGIYIVWPAFYTDVTDAYRLGKGGRLRTDLGGVYFNSIFSLATFGAYFLTGWEPLLLIVPLQILEMLHQFLPFIRLDGYYIVGDLTGVPDMFARIKPTLRSLNPLAETPGEVAVLRPWVRIAVTVYVLIVIPLLLLMLGLTVINLPRILSTAWDSFLLQKGKLGHEAALSTAVTVIQMAVLTLPIAGIAAMFWQLGKTLFVGGWQKTQNRPLARGALVLATASAAGAAAYVWLPNGDYRPIQPGERGTLSGGIRQLSAVPGGRPALTPQRQRQLDGAPLQAHLPPSQRRIPNAASYVDPPAPPTPATPSTFSTSSNGSAPAAPAEPSTPPTTGPATTSPATTTPTTTTPSTTTTTATATAETPTTTAASATTTPAQTSTAQTTPAQTTSTSPAATPTTAATTTPTATTNTSSTTTETTPATTTSTTTP